MSKKSIVDRRRGALERRKKNLEFYKITDPSAEYAEELKHKKSVCEKEIANLSKKLEGVE